MKIAIFGGCGFIGTHLTKELRSWGHEVVIFDLSNGPHQDLRKPKYVNWFLDAHKPDLVIHLAAKVGRLFGEDDVQNTVADNAGMVAVAAQICGQRGIEFVYASTSEVYGDNGDVICDEDEGPFSLPYNLYGISKFCGEQISRLYIPEENLKIWRISMPFGPGLPPGRGRAAIINFLYSALHGIPINCHRDSERAWCWIGDTVRGMRMTIEAGAPGIYNVGRDDNPTSMEDVAKMACDLLGLNYDLIEMVDAPANQTTVKRLSTAKLRRLGWEPRVELHEGMQHTLAWVEENYWEPVGV